MIAASDFRNGITLEYDGNVYQVVEFQHVKPGKGAAFVRAKLRNIIAGGIVEKTFRPTDKMPTAHIERREVQYLYKEDTMYHFMDLESYEQEPVNADLIGDSLKYVKENENVKLLTHNGRVFSVEAPTFVELVVTDTEPGFKGDTAQGATKPATVETGATINVPLFINSDDVIKIDTRTNEYLGRVNQ